MNSNSTKRTRSQTPELQMSFKTYILKLMRHVNREMKLGSETLKELDNFLAHMIDLLETEIRSLNDLKPQKTLNTEQLEKAVKLCLPGSLAQASTEYAKLAVRTYFEEIRLE
ncbi:hypothetical protein AVEN_136831-1 [Araneus ventricosus]|uniref:Histone H2A/H2B/H3 domain-containing protein n=1 Tax=Araneus ventricosus TaxID=182803 RepID=A0A4Y2JNU8_ARAVE|nr:hypothetical protein AVEN_136831-1 [Araneus ventricosus]